jgi:Na+-transporting NADH:ubiquinone oxidoreductase subunit C
MKDRIMMVVFVIVVGTILTGSLVGVNLATAPAIERNEALRLKRSILAALDLPVGESDEGVEAAFDAAVDEKPAGEMTFYVSRETGDVAFPYTGPGLWGPINGAIAVKDDFTRIRGLTVFHQEETPGLGSRITEPAYLSQFRDKSIGSGLVLVAPGKSTGDTQIDAITGATLTASAFVDLLNDNLAAAAEAYGGMAR